MASPGRSRRGFAGMDPARQREIARKGGEARSRNRQREMNNNNDHSNNMNDLM